MDIDASLLGRLVLLHRDAVGLGVGIVADASYLPGDLQPRLTAADLEAVVLIVPPSFALLM
jgi:hypothetical protein